MNSDIRQATDGTFYVLGEPFGGYESIIAEEFETYEEAERWLDRQRDLYCERGRHR